MEESNGDVNMMEVV